MKVVRRPVGTADGAAALRALALALDAEGIRPGEPFTVERLDPPRNELGPFVRDSDTSRDAALDNYPRAGSQRYRVVEYLRARPATRDELEVALGLSGSTIRPRVWELLHGGWVRETATTRRTRLGCDGHVLELTDKGRAYREVADAA